jgi:hypothetical protein
MGKPDSAHHVTTLLACEICHASTVTPGGFANWTMNHAANGNTSNCASCHLPSGDTTVTNAAGTTVVKGKPLTHIAISGAACESCHSTTSTSTGGFVAPSWTMGVAGHSVVSGARCDSCHNGQTFQGVTMVNAASLNSPHPSNLVSINGQDCGTCHGSVTSFQTSVTFNHAAQTNLTNCNYCHAANSTAALKGLSPTPGHMAIPANTQCTVCHVNNANNYTSFLMTSFNHVTPAAATLGSHQCATSCHNDSVNYKTKGQVLSPIHINLAYTKIASVSCDSCHLTTTTFTGSVMNHTGITTGCSNCHGAQFTDIVSKPATHIVTAAECESCHSVSSTSVGGFGAPNWTMNHAGITSGCTTCHGGQSFQGSVPNPPVTKAVNHVTTSAACEVCHSVTNTSAGGFAVPNPAMSHTGITTGCATCHTGANVGTSVTTISLGKPASHIATTAACETCHTNTTTPGGFATWTMNHTGITTGCVSCHTGATVGTTVIMGKPSFHIATTAECETCHSASKTSTGNFAAPNWTMNHTGITTACASCHKTTGDTTVGTATVKGVPTGHIAITAACESCHTSTTTPGGFATWTMDHAANGNTSACATCHGNGKTLLNTPTLVTLSLTAHVPVAGIACESCHTAGSTSTGGFATSALPMGTTGHNLVSATACSVCHDTGKTFTGVVTKSSAHIATTAACDSCHTSSNTSGFTTFLNASFNHTTIGATACSSCHGGSITGIVAKPSNHIPTTLECNVCHTTSPAAITTGSFTAWTMSHTGITTGCATCHASGLSFKNTSGIALVTLNTSNHIAVGTTACENCHTSTVTPGGFATWTMNHTGFTTGCASCHASGLSFTNTSGTPIVALSTTTHVPVGTLACESCHKNTGVSTGNFNSSAYWTMGTAGHALVSGTACATCHGTAGANFSGVKIWTVATHLATTAACDTCHTSSNTSGFANFLGATGAHTSNPIPSQGASCLTCHTGGTPGGLGTGGGKNMIANHVPIGALDCSACHTYTSFTSWTAATVHTAVTGTACSTCHDAGKTYVGVVTKSNPAITHITTTAACNICHTSTVSPGGFATWTMSHTGITTGCATCHASGLSFQNTSGRALVTLTTGPGNHIPVGTTACENCHSSTVTPGGFTTWTMSHTGFSTGCASCHATGLSFKNTSGTPLVTLSTTTHVPVGSLACESCHKATGTNPGNFDSSTYWTMGTAGHALVSGTTCATCHNDGTAFTGVVKQNSIIPHIATTAACDTCHTSSNTSGFANFLGATGAHASNPIPSQGASCLACHSGGTAGGFGTGGGKNMIANHVPIASLDCVACHTYTSFTTWTAATVHTKVIGTTCATCHDAGKTYVGVVTKSNPVITHIATTIACDSCHTSTTSPGGFKTWTMNHAANSNTTACATCHASTATAFTNTGTNTIVKLSTSIHVPTGTIACESCHSTTVVSTGAFATAWTMGTAGHTLVKTTSCATCHGSAGAGFTGVKIWTVATHLSTTAACDTCHTSTNTTGYTSFLGALGAHTSNPVPSQGATCLSCHSGGTAGGLGTGGGKNMIANHVPIAALDCSACHSYTSFTTWTAATVHTAVTGTTCATCHDTGKTYVGVVTKSSPAITHITTTIACDSCHTSTVSPGGFKTWTMNHAANGNNLTACATCHASTATAYTNTGTTAIVKLSTTIHVPTGTIACEKCHSTTAFSTGNFATAWTMGAAGHALVTTTTCATCHATAASVYTGVKVMTSAHFSTSYYPAQDCGTNCHTAASSSNYAVGGFTTLNMASNIPSHTGTGVSPYLCSNCHNNSIAVGTTSVTGFTHMAIGASDCVGCHTQTNTGGYANFLGATAGHDMSTAGIAAAKNNCATTCHKSGGSGKVFTAQHIPSSVPGAAIAGATAGQCDYCHTGSYTSMSFATATMSHATTAYPTMRCDVCHNGTYKAEGNVAGAQGISTLITNHIPSNTNTSLSSLDCGSCHTGTPVVSATGFLNEVMNHNGMQTGCVTCHLKGVTYLATGITRISHNGASATKDCSSSGCHKPLGSKGKPYTSWN